MPLNIRSVSIFPNTSPKLHLRFDSNRLNFYSVEFPLTSDVDSRYFGSITAGV